MIKEEINKILRNPAGKLLCVDLDGTLCTGEFWGESEPEPIKWMVEELWKLYKKGAHVVIYTARQPKYYAITYAWLIKHEVPFHGIAMLMKPGADLYIDDKSINAYELEPKV